jgi:hypothetical protein
VGPQDGQESRPILPHHGSDAGLVQERRYASTTARPQLSLRAGSRGSWRMRCSRPSHTTTDNSGRRSLDRAIAALGAFVQLAHRDLLDRKSAERHL